MPRVPSIALMAFVASGMVSAPLQAQWRTGSSRPVSVVVSAGPSVPSGAFRDYHELGIHGDLSLIVTFAGQGIRLRPEVTYQRFALKSQRVAVVPLAVSPSLDQRHVAPVLASLAPGEGGQGSDVSSVLGLIGNLELPLAGGLYLIGGVGASRFETGATAASGSASETALTYNGGAGFRFRLHAVTGFVEGRLQNFAIRDGTALFSDVRTIPISVGIAF